jgi:hypothetical protein
MTFRIPDDVWRKGKKDDNSGLVWRKDDCTAWIKYDEYGDRDSRFGWEVDYIDPTKGDSIDNKRPFHWKNYIAKSDGKTDCVVTSSGNENVGI